mmetsp:Transcript_13609/g.48033  ORF Transcript_13609/g.48033 Transcript_13609/m.48033 type:complete len:229 (-) Transcript_13609:1227-1913(-)
MGDPLDSNPDSRNPSRPSTTSHASSNNSPPVSCRRARQPSTHPCLHSCPSSCSTCNHGRSATTRLRGLSKYLRHRQLGRMRRHGTASWCRCNWNRAHTRPWRSLWGHSSHRRRPILQPCLRGRTWCAMSNATRACWPPGCRSPHTQCRTRCWHRSRSHCNPTAGHFAASTPSRARCCIRNPLQRGRHCSATSSPRAAKLCTVCCRTSPPCTSLQSMHGFPWWWSSFRR